MPVLTWSIRSPSPKRRTAAALSPPPTTVKPTPATASAIMRVPAANGATSNTPIGPFQRSRAAPPISAENAGRLGPDVEPLPVRRHCVRRHHTRLGVVRDLLGHDDVGRDADAPGVEEAPAIVDHLRLDERVPDRVPLVRGGT